MRATELEGRSLKTRSALKKAIKLVPIGAEFCVFRSLSSQCFRHAIGTLHMMEVGGGLQFDLRMSDHMLLRNFWMSYCYGASFSVLKRVVQPGMAVGADSVVVPCFHNQAPWVPSNQSPQER